MVAAKMPAITRPASRAGSRLVAMMIRIFSAEAEVSRAVGKSARPMIPMKTAAAREMTTHTVAMRRDMVNFFSLLIAMKRSSTCGIPK